MHQSSSMKANLAKAARIVLVFALVFWGSFRVEALAFAQMEHIVPGTVEDHAEDTLADFAVYEVAPDSEDADPEDADPEDADPEDENATGLGALMAKASDAGKEADGKEDGAVVKLSFEKPGETRDFVAIPSWKGKGFSIDEDKGTVEIANFVEWGLEFEEDEDGDEVECATMKASKDNPGYITLTSTGAGVVTVTCGLASAAQKDLTIDEGLDPKAKASFAVEIKEEKQPEEEEEEPAESHSVSVLMCDEKGNKLALNEGQLTISKDSLGKPPRLRPTTPRRRSPIRTWPTRGRRALRSPGASVLNPTTRLSIRPPVCSRFPRPTPLP